MYWRRPLTRLEAALYAGLVGVFMAIFIRYLFGYMETAERVAMQATLLNTSNALNVRLVQAFLARGAVPHDMAQGNPFEIAGALPPNFSDVATPAALEPGYWAYDRGRGEVVYLPRHRSGLQTEDDAPLLRFRLVRRQSGYFFEPVTHFRWE